MTMRTFPRSAFVALALVFSLTVAIAQTKRPLQHTDYDAWRSISGQQLSPDGNYLVYGLFPQEGDGEVVIRNLKTGVEWRHPGGARPEPPRPNQAEFTAEEPPQRQPVIEVHFSADNRFVVFSTFPGKAETDKARKEKKKPEDMPKGGMVIMELTSRAASTVPRVKSFQLPEKEAPSAVVAYLVAPAKAEAGSPKGAAAEAPAAESGEGATETRRPEKKKEFGSDLVLRNLLTGKERVLPDVTEYVLTKDGSILVYAVSSKQEDGNGVYYVATGGDQAPMAILKGRGKYDKLAFDEQQAQLAFLTSRDDAAAKQPKLKLYLWQRGASAPQETVSSTTPGFKEKYEISDKGSITFSRDGKRVFFGCAPTPPTEKDPANSPSISDDEKVQVDLWHWKDDYIQPMQKVRAELEKTRTYRAVYHIPEKKLVQLGDRSMPEIVPSENGLWALGGDDREYRSMLEYDARYADSYLVDTRSGQRTPLVKKHLGEVTWSPDNKYVLYFNDQHWIATSVPGAVTTILNPKDPVKLWREDFDMPSTPPPYGVAGWTRDGKYVLVYDEFDVWRMTPDGSEAVNLTQGIGRKEQLQFRHVNLNPDRKDPDARWIDPSQPLLLRAENKETRDTGFYRVSLDGKTAPQKLVMEAKAFTPPVKAKNADVLVLAASSFEQFPDLLVTDPDFRKLTKVSDAGAQKSRFLWGTAEMLSYRNVDGVPLHGILYKPENFDPKKKYPLLVYIYEKLSQTLHQFVEPRPRHTINISYYVSNGYLVLEPDIVYTVGQPGQSALKCVLPAIDAVIGRGFVDEKAIGIQGHSWGGYQIAYMLTQTNRFRAAAAGAPVANMTSAYDGIRWGPGLPRQFQYERSQSRIGGTLWQAPLLYIENSPIFAANRVSTPLMMIHNDADDAVPWYQGIEYFLALRRLGKEVYMFSYNGEPHGLWRRANQKDYSARLQQFFDYYLKGAKKPEWMDKGIPYLERDEEKEHLKSQVGVY